MRRRWQVPHLGTVARGGVLAAAALLTCAASARDTHLQLTLDAHTRATASLVGTRLHVVLAPGGQQQWLDADLDDGEATGSIRSDDYNFDGHPDLAVTVMLGQVNEATRVFLYDPAQRQFRLLAAPTRPQVQCAGFWNLTPDPQQRSLSSSCRSGPMWYADVYRYDAAGRLYVSTTQQPIAAQAILDVLGPGTEEGMPFSVWPRFDAQGAVIGTEIGQSLEVPRPATFLVQVPRLPLYATPTATTTRRYLIKGDRLEALDVSADQTRLQVRFRSAGHAESTGWIRADQAMP